MLLCVIDSWDAQSFFFLPLFLFFKVSLQIICVVSKWRAVAPPSSDRDETMRVIVTSEYAKFIDMEDRI